MRLGTGHTSMAHRHRRDGSSERWQLQASGRH
jgi:hypothetical protein